MKNYFLALGLLGGIVLGLSDVEAHYAPYGSYLHSRYHHGFSGHLDGTTDHGYPTVEMIAGQNNRTYHNHSYYGAPQIRYEEVELFPLFPTGGGRNFPGKPWSSSGSY